MRSAHIRMIIITLIVSLVSLPMAQDQAWAMLAPAAIPASPATTVSPSDRNADMATVQKALESKILRHRLHELGYSDEEVQMRLSKLSDQDLHQMATQIRTLNPGGDLLIGILIVVVLILLIIYLFKRI
jgi:hypothetical protein